MADTIQFQLVSPERVLVDEPATEIQIPARDGYIGVLPGHAPLLSELKPGGVLTYSNGGQTKAIAVYGGFVEVLPDRVRVLGDAAEFSQEISREKAQVRLQAAMRALEDSHAGADPAVALDEMMRAQAAVEAVDRK